MVLLSAVVWWGFTEKRRGAVPRPFDRSLKQ